MKNYIIKYGKRKTFIRIAIGLVALMAWVSGCSKIEQGENGAFEDRGTIGDNGAQQYFTDEQEPEASEEKEDHRTTFFKIGQELKELDKITGINDTVILVDGHVITRKMVETEKIYIKYCNHTTIKESIEEMIRMTAVQAEAERRGIKPSEEKIDAYVKQLEQTLDKDVPGAEIEFALMEGMDLSREEYLLMQKETAYRIYQREALWLSANASQDGGEYDRYMDNIAQKAKVEILDSEIEQLLQG